MKTTLRILALAGTIPAALHAADKPAAIEDTPASVSAPQDFCPCDRVIVGIETIPLDEPTRSLLNLGAGAGVLVTGVLKGSPADTHLAQGDIVLRIDSTPIRNTPQLGEIIRAKSFADSPVFTVLRGGVEKKVTVKLFPVTTEQQVEANTNLGPGTQSQLGRMRLSINPSPDEIMGYLNRQTQSLGTRNGLADKMLREAMKNAGVDESIFQDFQNPAPFGNAPSSNAQPGGATRGSGSTSIIRRSSSRTVVNGNGRVTVTEIDGQHGVEVSDPSGKMIASGKLTPELRKKIPAWALEIIDGKTPLKEEPRSAPDEPRRIPTPDEQA